MHVYVSALHRKYPQATREQVEAAVQLSLRGAKLLGLPPSDSSVIRAAEANIRLTLGLELREARTDPETHPKRRKLEARDD